MEFKYCKLEIFIPETKYWNYRKRYRKWTPDILGIMIPACQ